MNLIRIPSKERGCATKINLGHNFRKQADRLADKRRKRFGVYHCPHCGGYHLTTKIEKAQEYGGLLYVTMPNTVVRHADDNAPHA